MTPASKDPKGRKDPKVDPAADDVARQARWDAAAAWGRSSRLNELETTMWRSERHPEQSSTIASLLLLDTSPDWDRLVAAHEWAGTVVPRSRERVMDPLVPTHTPVWVPDPRFALPFHLRRLHLGARDTMADLLELVSTLVISPFDRSRPLWEATLIEGLEGDRAAYLLKLHHSMTDGLGAVQLLSALQSRTRRHTPKPSPAHADPAPEPTPLSLAADGITETVRAVPGLARRLAGVGMRVARDPFGTAFTGLGYAGSMRRALSPKTDGGAPLLSGRGGGFWILGEMQCPLADLRAAGHAAGGSVNDAYLAALLGGVRKYHEYAGVEVEDIPITVPVSLRRDDDPLGGNKFAGAMLAAPAGVVDPAERIAIIRGLILSATNEPALDTFSAIAPVVNRLPSAVGATAMKLGARNDLAASNVPGIRETVYLAGAKVDRVIPYGPLPGVAVMSVMTSYAGTCSVGLTMDPAAVEEPELFVECLREGFAEVLALAE